MKLVIRSVVAIATFACCAAQAQAPADTLNVDTVNVGAE